jgi:maltooligosyltrehalose trehalohydrolase
MPERSLPVGAELVEGGVHFRVWAPPRRRVAAVVYAQTGPARLPGPAGGGRIVELEREAGGYFSGLADGVGAGARYGFRLGNRVFPDPASRFQPDGPFGVSEVVDPTAHAWSDSGWTGIEPHRHVFYELHVGTFCRDGTWAGVERRLPYLADLGVTTLELMPAADFPGRFGWGYDGVDLYAPTRLYGRPDALRRLVDAAHGAGLAVILDVVYNHFGPAGCFLREFSPRYFSDRYEGEWGDPLNFDGADAEPVREFVIANAAYWIREFHLDGLRLDATQSMFDASPQSIVAEVTAAARAAAPHRRVLVVAENEPQDPALFSEATVDAAWNDDFHHAAHVAATGCPDAYMCHYRGTAQELLSAVKRGWLYQGQWDAWQGKPRGQPALGVSRRRFVHYLQNHDQVANSFRGERLHEQTSPGRLRALTALLLLSPQLPLLLQGQETAAASPFAYFADHDPELARLVRAGRFDFLAQFAALSTDEARALLPVPEDPQTFVACILDDAHRERRGPTFELHRDLLRLRREDPVISQRDHELDGAVLGSEAFVLRWFGDGADRVLAVNLGRSRELAAVAEPLLAPPAAGGWRILWSSDDPRYGGSGPIPLPPQGPAAVRAHSALLLGGSA